MRVARTLFDNTKDDCDNTHSHRPQRECEEWVFTILREEEWGRVCVCIVYPGPDLGLAHGCD